MKTKNGFTLREGFVGEMAQLLYEVIQQRPASLDLLRLGMIDVAVTNLWKEVFYTQQVPALTEQYHEALMLMSAKNKVPWDEAMSKGFIEKIIEADFDEINAEVARAILNLAAKDQLLVV